MKALKAAFGALATAAILVLIPLGASAVTASAAEVRFGRNVRVGGHDFSNQRFDRKRRAEIHLHNRAPARAGCAWRSDGHGGQVETCHLRRIRPR